MKFIVIFAISFISSSLYAQTPLPMIDGKVVFEQIDTFPNSSKNILYKKAKLWQINSYPAKEKNIITDNKDSALLISYGMTPFGYTYGSNNINISFNCYYLIQVVCSEDKTRIKFYDIKVKERYGHSKPIENWSPSGSGIDNASKEQKQKVFTGVNALMLVNLASFKNAMGAID
jgi:hypothetical protein